MDNFLQPSFHTTPSFPGRPTFTRTTEAGIVQASILDWVFSPSDDCWIEVEEPLFDLDVDHLLVCFTMTTPDHFSIARIPDAPPPKFSVSRLSPPFVYRRKTNPELDVT